jgi:hypothetical protein
VIVAGWLAAALVVAAASADALLTELQRAIRRDDRQAVAALIQYPITIATAGIRIPIRDAPSMVKSFDAVFTPELKAAIRDGTAIRDGLVQVTPVEGTVKITGISPAYGLARGNATPTSSRAPPRGPRRVTFGTVEIAQLSGSLAPGGSDAFVVSVEKGGLLEARIDRVPGRDVVLKVVDAKSGRPLDANAAAGARRWIGRVPESADYRIDVTRPAQHGGELLPYVLVVRRR